MYLVDRVLIFVGVTLNGSTIPPLIFRNFSFIEKITSGFDLWKQDMSDENESKNPKSHLILICVDKTPQSRHAFDWYYSNFYRSNHVIGFFYVYSDHSSFAPFHKSDDKNKSFEIVNQYQNVCTDRGIETRVFMEAKADSVGHTICNFIKQHSDVKGVIMGTQSRGLVRRTLSGSISSYVMHHSHKPLLVIPSEFI